MGFRVFDLLKSKHLCGVLGVVTVLALAVGAGCGDESDGDNRPTWACDSDQDCGGRVPYCEYETGDCEECLKDSHCGGEPAQCVSIYSSRFITDRDLCMDCREDEKRCGEMKVCEYPSGHTYCENGVPVDEYEEQEMSQ